VNEVGIKEDPSFPEEGFGARNPAVSGPAAATPGARPGAVLGATDNPQVAIEGA
jgi:hypothetical protein